MKKDKLSIVIPVMNEEENVPLLYSRLKKLAKTLKNINLELIFVDDGSTDQTFTLLINLKRNDKSIRIIKLSRNFGSWEAIMAGLTTTKGDCVGIITADLQDPPELFEKMVELWREGNKKILAVRDDRKDSFFDRSLAQLYYRILRKFILPQMPKGGFDCMLLDKSLIKTIKTIDTRNTSFTALISWIGYKTTYVSYVRNKRMYGRSKWHFWRKLKLAIDAVTSFSYFPIRMISLIGLIILILDIFYLFYTLFKFHQFTNFIIILISIFFIASLQLIALGILGEYLWRNFTLTQKRPQYIIEKII